MFHISGQVPAECLPVHNPELSEEGCPFPPTFPSSSSLSPNTQHQADFGNWRVISFVFVFSLSWVEDTKACLMRESKNTRLLQCVTATWHYRSAYCQEDHLPPRGEPLAGEEGRRPWPPWLVWLAESTMVTVNRDVLQPAPSDTVLLSLQSEHIVIRSSFKDVNFVKPSSSFLNDNCSRNTGLTS